MCDSILLTIDDDGVAHRYDDTFDITIHCESQEEQDKVIRMLNEMRWIPVSERLPDLWDERYLVSLAYGGIGVMEYKSTGFHNYGSFTPVPIETVTAWMTLPKPYKREEHEK